MHLQFKDTVFLNLVWFEYPTFPVCMCIFSLQNLLNILFTCVRGNLFIHPIDKQLNQKQRWTFLSVN